MTKVNLSIVIPPRGKRPAAFRRKFIERIREAAARLAMNGNIDFEIAEEIFRVFPIEEPRK